MNSAHQWWSRWTAVITPDPARAVLDHAAVREHCARFVRPEHIRVTTVTMGE